MKIILGALKDFCLGTTTPDKWRSIVNQWTGAAFTVVAGVSMLNDATQSAWTPTLISTIAGSTVLAIAPDLARTAMGGRLSYQMTKNFGIGWGLLAASVGGSLGFLAPELSYKVYETAGKTVGCCKAFVQSAQAVVMSAGKAAASLGDKVHNWASPRFQNIGQKGACAIATVTSAVAGFVPGAWKFPAAFLAATLGLALIRPAAQTLIISTSPDNPPVTEPPAAPVTVSFDPENLPKICESLNGKRVVAFTHQPVPAQEPFFMNYDRENPNACLAAVFQQLINLDAFRREIPKAIASLVDPTIFGQTKKHENALHAICRNESLIPTNPQLTANKREAAYTILQVFAKQKSLAGKDLRSLRKALLTLSKDGWPEGVNQDSAGQLLGLLILNRLTVSTVVLNKNRMKDLQIGFSLLGIQQQSKPGEMITEILKHVIPNDNSNHDVLQFRQNPDEFIGVSSSAEIIVACGNKKVEHSPVITSTCGQMFDLVGVVYQDPSTKDNHAGAMISRLISPDKGFTPRATERQWYQCDSSQETANQVVSRTFQEFNTEEHPARKHACVQIYAKRQNTGNCLMM